MLVHVRWTSALLQCIKYQIFSSYHNQYVFITKHINLNSNFSTSYIQNHWTSTIHYTGTRHTVPAERKGVWLLTAGQDVEISGVQQVGVFLTGHNCAAFRTKLFSKAANPMHKYTTHAHAHTTHMKTHTHIDTYTHRATASVLYVHHHRLYVCLRCVCEKE